MEKVGKVQCQRMNCHAMFSDDDNPEGSCRFHDSGPIFHDGMKEWSCCKQRSHHFRLFLQIAGCKVGKRTSEIPVPKKPAPVATPTNDASSKEACSRCRQGFFCSEHGSQVKVMNSNPLTAAAPALADSNTDEQGDAPAPAKKVVDINHPETCKNNGCDKTFKERDNHDTACSYDPGPAIFHYRMDVAQCLIQCRKKQKLLSEDKPLLPSIWVERAGFFVSLFIIFPCP
ncbi:cysteine and histidine-rich domain-containing protein RAR1-like [Diospyros lotus]|uniref:cysteine and histidine-rich domain-containing protein RAR1-like n=1 Tax=Diospyros lotus TaxID=55363 RepID=UPI0022582406|nr:cysteine and histidine-rich domain-containing protein RAR1-like [Diospyros lotus]